LFRVGTTGLWCYLSGRMLSFYTWWLWIVNNYL
jgi:hypothetical protein